MNNSLDALCAALKKILHFLKPQQNAISFLLLTGKINQGKTALLKQSNLIHYPISGETAANFFYNQHGVILELGESWLNQSETLLATTLKQLNRCHSSIRISGMVLCVDSSELLANESLQLIEQCKAHAQLLERFGQALGYAVETTLLFTKLDGLAGFCDFFQAEHHQELAKPLGFSLEPRSEKKKLLENYRQQFDLMIEVLGQQIISKLHPARSSVKRTLMREFPLQLASLRVPIQSLLQNLPLQLFQIKAIYFTSAEQGGISIDKLNKKIQHEYSLIIQDKFPQSNNYRSYFIDGALKTLQEQSKRYTRQISSSQKWLLGSTALLMGLVLLFLGQQYFKTSQLLDEASKEILIYETLLNQRADKTAALYHLSLATTKLEKISTNIFSLSIIDQLKIQLHSNNQQHLYENFLPQMLSEIEKLLVDPLQTQSARYQALKIYLMLGDPTHYSENDVTQWFKEYWQRINPNASIHKQLLLLNNALKQPLQPLNINKQIVSDARNFLNALPATYLYYTLAKNHFSKDTQPISIEAIDLASKELPYSYTKKGFKEIISTLPVIAKQLQEENWVLARQDLDNLNSQLEQAYCLEYVTWWQNFIHRTKPKHYQLYDEARQVTQSLYKNNSLTKLIRLIQDNTSPESSEQTSLFNQKITNEFTNINLMSHSSTTALTNNINELEKFITTLSLINDNGRTAFNFTKARFEGGQLSDPLSVLYNRVQQLPEPVSTWTKQIADDSWFIFINETRRFLNVQWQETVYNEYQTKIINRYPLESTETAEVDLVDFNHFFAPHGSLNNFVNLYLKSFLNTSTPQWQPKEVNGYVLPISSDLTNELIRANVITNMFFTDSTDLSKITFSLQKINLDPVVANLQLTIGKTTLTDNQNSDSYTLFSWPQSNAKLSINSIEGNHYELEEVGTWAFFKILQKVNVLVDSEDSSSLQILFEVNGNSGRYLLKAQNQINPFSPGILAGFTLKETLT